MINTSQFESLMRYKKLQEALLFIESSSAIHYYSWMRDELRIAIAREEVFVENNKNVWLMDTQIRKNETLNRPIEEEQNENQKTNESSK